MSGEVRAMIDVRHQAEQRGHYEPLGRLLSLETGHGIIQFGSQQGELVGPDLAWGNVADAGSTELENTLLVLGEWVGLPALRKNTATPCSKCKHECDICAGTGKKQCEGLDCGGRGYTHGLWLPCPGPQCFKDTGHFKADCATCTESEIRGQIREHVECKMCKGTGIMVCSRCRGTKKFSTGRVNGSLDWRMPACKACAGTGFKGEFIKQDVAKFTNAELRCMFKSSKAMQMDMLALGPIHSFTVKDFNSGNFRVFDVNPDAAGDYLMLLVPKVQRRNARAYLVGGVVRERSGQAVA